MSQTLLPPSVPSDASPQPDAHGDRVAARRNLRTHQLLQAASGAEPAERQRLLGEAVLLNQEVAHSIARRYRARGIPEEDLRQVASLALVKAVQRFDPSAGHDFLSFAVPTMQGEVKRYFRDHGWMVRPTRRLQELQARIYAAESNLAQSLGRSPRPSEIARELDEDVEDVREALATDGCFTPTSLDRQAGPEHDACELGELIGADDPGAEAVEARAMLSSAVRRLGERDRRILMLRFFRGWTQQEIGRDLGVTQMQVSRLLSRILSQLRTELDAETWSG